MTVQYRAKGAHYDCSVSRINHVQTPGCRSVKAAGVDELVAGRLLAALAPEEIAVALAAADEVSERRARSDRALELRVERARYDAARAERAFHACEPENRLVASQPRDPLGDKSSANSLTPRPSSPSRPRHGRSPHASSSRRSRVTCPRYGPQQHIREGPQAAAARGDRRRHDHLPARGSRRSVGIRWRSGAAEQHTIQRPPSINDTTRTPPETVELIRRLAPGRTNTEIADQLNAAGLRTGKGLPFNDHAVRHIRRAHNIPTTPLTHTTAG